MRRRRRSITGRFAQLMAYLDTGVRVVPPTPPPPLPASLRPARIGRGAYDPDRHTSPILRALAKAAAAASVTQVKRRNAERFTGSARIRSKHAIIAHAARVHRGVVARLLRGEAIGLDAACRIAEAIGRPLVLNDDLGLDDL